MSSSTFRSFGSTFMCSAGKGTSLCLLLSGILQLYRHRVSRDLNIGSSWDNRWKAGPASQTTKWLSPSIAGAGVMVLRLVCKALSAVACAKVSI